MYTEEFEGFEEEEKGPRTYVSNMSNFSQQDAERLARENEKLKKNLEKEKFFNKLLDQEIKELKTENSSKYPSDYPSRSGVSKGAFYTLFFLALAMAGFIFYTLYNNKQYNLFDSSSVNVSQVDQASPAEQTQNFSTVPGNAASNNELPTAPKDSVPNIIGNNKNVAGAEKKTEVKNKPVENKPVAAAPKDEEYNEAEVEAVLKEPVTTATKKPAASATPKTTTPPPANTATTDQTQEQQASPAAQQPSRPVIAKYRVSSKANFYNGPDENTLRSAFISAGANKFVDALDDKNGFIYVEYVNDHGMLSKGWLSKADLTKAE